MIKKSIACFILLLLLHFCITRLAVNQNVVPQNLWQGHLIRGEQFLLDSNYENVIVGSSLANRISDEDFPNSSWVNLSFGGMGVLDGLKLISSKGVIPKTLLIEVNVISRGENVTYQKALFSKFWIKRNLNYMREDQRPILMVHPFSERIIRKTLGKLEYELLLKNKKTTSLKQSNKDNIESFQEAKNENLRGQIERYNEIPEQEIQNNITEIDNYLKQLDSKGCEIIFFEMPIGKELCHLPLSNYVREEVKKKFDYLFILFL